MTDEKVTVVIPTYNRSECIEKLIEECYLSYKGTLFEFEIHDSSTDDKTKNYIENVKRVSPLRYYSYSSDINGDIKTNNAIRDVKTSYVYLMGDGILIDFNKLEEFLLKENFDKYAVVAFREKELEYYKKHEADKIPINSIIAYENIQNFCKDNFWKMTLYGSAIIKTSIMTNENLEDIRRKYYEFESPFTYVCTIFQGLYLSPEICAFAYVDFLKFNNLKKGSGWVQKKQAIDFFCYKYYKSVSMLPEIYNSCSRDFLTAHNSCTKLFSLKQSILLRYSGNISFKIVKKYWKYIKLTVKHPCTLVFVSFIPIWFLKLLKKLYKLIFRRK